MKQSTTESSEPHIISQVGPVHPAIKSMLAERSAIVGDSCTYVLFNTRKAALSASRDMQSAGYKVRLPSWPIPMVIKSEIGRKWILEINNSWSTEWRVSALAVIGEVL